MKDVCNATLQRRAYHRHVYLKQLITLFLLYFETNQFFSAFYVPRLATIDTRFHTRLKQAQPHD